jgi:hypothetical protein
MLIRMPLLHLQLVRQLLLPLAAIAIILGLEVDQLLFNK